MRWDLYVLELCELEAKQEADVLVREHRDVTVACLVEGGGGECIAKDREGKEVEILDIWDDFPVRIYEDYITITGSIRGEVLGTGYGDWYLHEAGVRE